MDPQLQNPDSNSNNFYQQEPASSRTEPNRQQSKKQSGSRRRKVSKACVYCRRSHMTCDEVRPCSRCVRRSIGHLCCDEPRESKTPAQTWHHPLQELQDTHETTQMVQQPNIGLQARKKSSLPLLTTKKVADMSTNNALLESFDPLQAQSFLFQSYPLPTQLSKGTGNLHEFYGWTEDPFVARYQLSQTAASGASSEHHAPGTAGETAREKFFLTAADPTNDQTPEERLKQVINAKLEAGLLKPFNYVKGYQRLNIFMDTHLSPVARNRIIKHIAAFRPKFRKIAQGLTDVDLILVEEDFERLLLDYDRIFTSIGIPACLWRRTGEIYRGNKEFAALLDVPLDDLRDGRLAISEIMAEDSTVNYWEKYGNIAFDQGQKAVLTSCALRNPISGKNTNCCFSFTIRRDRYGMYMLPIHAYKAKFRPSCIIGNFIPMTA